MKAKIIFVERKFWEFVSIEKVFRQIEKKINHNVYTTSFFKLKYSNSIIGLLKNILTFKIEKADIYHITGHIHYISLRLPRNKTILTIHDLGFLHSSKGLRRFLLKKLYLDIPVRKLKYITTISDATKSEIVFHTNCDINKIRVIENPLSEEFYTETTKKFDGVNPSILQIGTTANKNLLNLIMALKGIDCELDIVGKLSTEQSDLLKKNNIKYKNSYGLTDTEIVEKYKNADMVSFCSTFEGFGLPIIEAQAMRKPVITSNISPLKEVAGEFGAVLVDPNSIEDIRDGIKKIISDRDLRKLLIKNGLENIKRFDAKNISKKYMNLYKEVLEKQS